jgi:hypothetical protein
MRKHLVALLISAALAHPLSASTDALAQLCKVWSAVKFLDPQLMVQPVDWDAALIRAILVRRSKSTSERTRERRGHVRRSVRATRADRQGTRTGAVARSFLLHTARESAALLTRSADPAHRFVSGDVLAGRVGRTLFDHRFDEGDTLGRRHREDLSALLAF